MQTYSLDKDAPQILSKKLKQRCQRLDYFNFSAINTNPFKIPGYSTGAKLTAGCSAIGLGALVYNGFNLSNSKDRALDRAVVWPQYVRSRIGKGLN